MPEHSGYTQSPGSVRQQKFAAQRRRYAELRAGGMTPFDAATELGLDPWDSGGRYERWLQAEQSGQLEGRPAALAAPSGGDDDAA